MEKKITEKNERRAQIFKALGHPTRVQIIELISEKERCVQELSQLLSYDNSTISKHLSILKNANLISS